MIKRKRKRNPHIDDILIELLKLAINYGQPEYLILAITYYKQGRDCNDCDKYYEDCKCEYCNDCGFNRCLCDLGFISSDYKYAYTLNNDRNRKLLIIYKDKIRKAAEKFAKEVLTKEQLKQLDI